MFARSIAAAACILSLVACAGSEPSSDDSASYDQAATSAAPSCGASYGKANELYKQAVAIAKTHKVDACGGLGANGEEGAYLTSIAGSAAKATASCGAFANVIKSSPWAAPIREELKGNLALAVLTGDLEIKNAKGEWTYKGLDAALPGVTLWGPAPGVYGNASKIEFGANGKATLSHHEWENENATGPTWKAEEATYKIGGVAGDTVLITITTAAGISTDYDLKATTTYEGGPDFEMTPIEKEGDTFTAYISECEA